MKNEIKTCLYPFDIESSPVLRYPELLGDIKIVSVVSPEGWGLAGKDAGYADQGSPIGITVTSDFDKALGMCESVLFTASHMPVEHERILYPQMSKAISNGKNIICNVPLKEEVKNKFMNHCRSSNISFSYCQDGRKGISSSLRESGSNFLYSIHAPVIFVIGDSERTNKFYIQLSLRSNFISKGYRVSQIGTRTYCELLGFHSFPELMLDSCICGEKKIRLFNNYVKNIELEEKPDIIIIGIPGGIFPQHGNFSDGFGFPAYEVSCAVRSDAAVMGMLYEDYNEEYLEWVINTVFYKYGFSTDCFSIANAQFDYPNSDAFNRRIYTTLDSNFIDVKKEKFVTMGFKAYNILNAEDADNIFQHLVKKLPDYNRGYKVVNT